MVKIDLKGQVAIVTGCGRGIGEAMAEVLAKAGADIIGIGSSSDLSSSKIKTFVESLGQKFYGYQVNLEDRASIYKFVNAVRDNFDKIDILVNNAGTILRAPAAEHSDEYWDKVIKINLDAQFILSREIGKMMIDKHFGKIIFTASLLSFQGGINVPGYAASKGAIASLIKALSNEWASKGINVNGIAPGYISTENTEAIRNDPERSKSILSRIPAGRWGEAKDIEGATLFLASNLSNYIHGTIITVDGGWMGR